MRVILVGSTIDCARLRAALDGAAIDVVGEARTLAAARALDTDADAYLLAPNDRDRVQRQRREPVQRAAAAAREWGAAHDGANDPLTPREIQVLEHLAEGLPNKAIAARLAISDQTVKFHVAAICGKLGAANRTDAVRRAVRRGLITL
jgi:DNA-binding NarL/FixJ family response regulator